MDFEFLTNKIVRNVFFEKKILAINKIIKNCVLETFCIPL